jgi:hypothetical protein
MSFETPVLLIAWRRPHTTRKVIDSIRAVAPSRMFVACDGPNPHRSNEAGLVAGTRAVIDREIDWPCMIERRYSEKNHGCRLGVSNAISWFFERVDEGIILEDDCVPHPDFFPYCAELLARYRDDSRIWCISGDNSAGIHLTGDWSYGFIRTPLIWGWATWRRAWKNYDDPMQAWRNIRATPLLECILSDRVERETLAAIFNRLTDFDQPDSWAYRWTCASLLNSGLCLIPARNLVSNVGFAEDATHTVGHVCRSSVPTDSVLPLLHPPIVCLDRHADAQVFHKVHGGAELRITRRARNFMRRVAQVKRLLFNAIRVPVPGN